MSLFSHIRVDDFLNVNKASLPVAEVATEDITVPATLRVHLETLNKFSLQIHGGRGDGKMPGLMILDRSARGVGFVPTVNNLAHWKEELARDLKDLAEDPGKYGLQ